MSAPQETTSIPQKIVTAKDLRAVMLRTIEGVLAGKISIAQGNSVASLSAEVHKSLRQEWDMAIYANSNLGLENGKLIRLIEG